MTLEKVYQAGEMEKSVPLTKLIKQNNPFKTIAELYSKAGMSPEDVNAFQKNPDHLTVKNLNKILSLCEFDLKCTALFGEDLQELNMLGQNTTIFTVEEEAWEEEDMDWEDELEEDEAYF